MNDLTVQEVHALAQANVESLIEKMLPLEQADCPVLHYFAEGIYIREVRFPAGVAVVGHLQKCVHMNVFIQGKVEMLNLDGSTVTLEAPMTFVGQPGRKIGHILEDVIWQNVYPNPDNCQDIEALEAKWLDQTPCFEAFKQLQPNDFPKMLEDLEVSAEQVWGESNIENDLIPFPPGPWNKLAVRESPIHGKGLFAEANIAAGEMVCPARIHGKRTPAGRYTNHSGLPNVAPVKVFGIDIGWVALRDIHGRRGGMNGEEITVDYREVRKIA